MDEKNKIMLIEALDSLQDEIARSEEKTQDGKPKILIESSIICRLFDITRQILGNVEIMHDEKGVIYQTGNIIMTAKEFNHEMLKRVNEYKKNILTKEKKAIAVFTALKDNISRMYVLEHAITNLREFEIIKNDMKEIVNDLETKP